MPDLIRRGVGRHVKVLRPQIQQQIAHRAADHIAFKSGIGEFFADLQCAVIQPVAMDAVLGQRQNTGGAGGSTRFAAEHLIDDATDH